DGAVQDGHGAGAEYADAAAAAVDGSVAAHGAVDNHRRGAAVEDAAAARRMGRVAAHRAVTDNHRGRRCGRRAVVDSTPKVVGGVVAYGAVDERNLGGAGNAPHAPA